jgi:hypothetical protein
VIDPVRVPSKGVAISYRDTVFHPLYGSVELSESPTAAAGSRALRAKLAPRALPEPERDLVAEVALFGRGDPEKAALSSRHWLVTR